MANKTQNKIIGILEENEEMDANGIAEKAGVAYDTAAKHLKHLSDGGILTREARKCCIKNRENGTTVAPWTYFYKLNKNEGIIPERNYHQQEF